MFPPLALLKVEYGVWDWSQRLCSSAPHRTCVVLRRVAVVLVSGTCIASAEVHDGWSSCRTVLRTGCTKVQRHADTGRNDFGMDIGWPGAGAIPQSSSCSTHRQRYFEREEHLLESTLNAIPIHRDQRRSNSIQPPGLQGTSSGFWDWDCFYRQSRNSPGADP